MLIMLEKPLFLAIFKGWFAILAPFFGHFIGKKRPILRWRHRPVVFSGTESIGGHTTNTTIDTPLASEIGEITLW